MMRPRAEQLTRVPLVCYEGNCAAVWTVVAALPVTRWPAGTVSKQPLGLRVRARLADCLPCLLRELFVLPMRERFYGAHISPACPRHGLANGCWRENPLFESCSAPPTAPSAHLPLSCNRPPALRGLAATEAAGARSRGARLLGRTDCRRLLRPLGRPHRQARIRCACMHSGTPREHSDISFLLDPDALKDRSLR